MDVTQAGDARTVVRDALVFASRDPSETAALGEVLGRVVRPGAVLLLKGPFGAGKTSLVQGIARGMGIEGYVTSPSFTLANVYPGSGTARLNHLDLYRIRSAAEALDLGLDEYLERTAVCAIEWPDPAESVLPADHVVVDVEIDPAGTDARRFRFSATGPDGWATLERLREAADRRPR